MNLFKYNKGIAHAIKEIYQSVDVWMLTHLQDISFSLLLIYFYWLHISFPYYFDGHFLRT